MLTNSLLEFFIYFCTLNHPHAHSQCVSYMAQCYTDNAAMQFPTHSEDEDGFALEYCMERSENEVK